MIKIQRWTIQPDAAIEISVLVPCWHVEPTIAGALESIADQEGLPEGVHVEVVLVVDGRPQDLAAIKQVIAERNQPFPFDLCLVSLAVNVGAGMARHIGYRHCRGSLLAFLDDDDLWHPAKLAIQWQWHQRHPMQICSAHGYRIKGYQHIDIEALVWLYFDDVGSSATATDFFRLMIGGCSLHPSSLMIRCAHWPHEPEPLRFGEDWLMLAMIAYQQAIVILPGDLAWRSPQVPTVMQDRHSLSRQRWSLRCGKMQAIRILQQRGLLPRAMAMGLLAWNLLLQPRRYLLDAIDSVWQPSCRASP